MLKITSDKLQLICLHAVPLVFLGLRTVRSLLLQMLCNIRELLGHQLPEQLPETSKTMVNRYLGLHREVGHLCTYCLSDFQFT